MRNGRRIVGLFLLMFGVMGLFRLMDNPRLQALKGSDLLGLLAPGLCLGFGMALLLGRLMFRGD